MALHKTSAHRGCGASGRFAVRCVGVDGSGRVVAAQIQPEGRVSVAVNATIDDFLGNDGWFDDVSDDEPGMGGRETPEPERPAARPDPAPAETPTTLADTGADVGTPLLAGLLLLTTGTVLRFVRRRRTPE